MQAPVPPTCPMERNGAGNNGESRRASRERAGQRLAWSGQVRVRDLPHWGSSGRAARLPGSFETRPTFTYRHRLMIRELICMPIAHLLDGPPQVTRKDYSAER